MENPTHQDLYDMASRFGGLDTPESVTLTGTFDRAYLSAMEQQFGLSVTETAAGTLVHS